MWLSSPLWLQPLLEKTGVTLQDTSTTNDHFLIMMHAEIDTVDQQVSEHSCGCYTYILCVYIYIAIIIVTHNDCQSMSVCVLCKCVN